MPGIPVELGIVYKLYCVSEGGAFYVGSTNNLNARFIYHLNASIADGYERNPLYARMAQTGGGVNWRMDILATLANCTRQDLLRLEQSYMDSLKPTLNRNRAWIDPATKVSFNSAKLRCEQECECGKKISMRNMARHAQDSAHHRNFVFRRDLEVFIWS